MEDLPEGPGRVAPSAKRERGPGERPRLFVTNTNSSTRTITQAARSRKRQSPTAAQLRATLGIRASIIQPRNTSGSEALLIPTQSKATSRYSSAGSTARSTTSARRTYIAISPSSISAPTRAK
jgi:hypothetical protein